MSAKDFPFPILKMNDILQCMDDLNIPLNEQDITKPNPQQLQKIYESFLEIFKGVPKERFSQPRFELLDMLEYPELHNNSLTLIAFYKTL